MARAKNTPAASETAPTTEVQAHEAAPSPTEALTEGTDGTPAGEAPPSPATPELASPVGGNEGGEAAGAETPAVTPVPCLLVRGPAKGRWRAGMKFGPEPVVVPLAEITIEQARAIQDDPELFVTEL